MMKKIVSTLAGATLVLGLGIAAVSNVVANAPVQVQTEMRAMTSFCQVCEWVWNPNVNRWVRSCHLVVCTPV